MQSIKSRVDRLDGGDRPDPFTQPRHVSEHIQRTAESDIEKPFGLFSHHFYKDQLGVEEYIESEVLKIWDNMWFKWVDKIVDNGLATPEEGEAQKQKPIPSWFQKWGVVVIWKCVSPHSREECPYVGDGGIWDLDWEKWHHEDEA